MNSRIVLSITLGLLMIGGSASIGAYSNVGSIPASASLSIGTYSYNLSSEGLVSDIVYSTAENSTLLVHSVFINGSSTLNISASGNRAAIHAGLDATPIQNGTLYYQAQQSALVFVTYSNISGSAPHTVISPAMTFNLNNSLEQLTLTPVSDLSGPFGDYLEQDLLLQMDQNWSLYRVDNTVYNGYFFTNGNSSLSNSNTTIDVAGISNRVSLNGTAFSILVSGFISSGDFVHLMNTYVYQHQNYHKFTYNPSTGLVSGQYLNFTFNDSTGAITNLVSRLPVPTQVFSSIMASGNGSLGSPFLMPFLPLNQVELFGSIFFYADSSFIYGIHNNPSLQMNMLLDNGSMLFTLPAGMNVTALPTPYGQNLGFNLTPLKYDPAEYQDYGLGVTNQVMSGSWTYLIYGGDVRGFLTVSGGNATYNATAGTIEVAANGTALINFVMPPGLSVINSAAFQELRYAYEHGKVAGQISCDYLNGTPLNYSFLYNNSLNFTFLGDSPGQVHFQASSGMSQGTNLAFFVNKTYLNSTGNVYLYINGNEVNRSASLDTVLNSTAGSPSYYALSTSEGYMILLHIPHFSAYNITISGESTTGGGQPVPAWVMPAIVGAAMVIIVVSAYFIMVRKRP